MKVDCTLPVVHIGGPKNGEQIVITDDAGKEVERWTLGLVFVRSLWGADPNKKILQEESLKRFILACKIQDAMLPVELTNEEAVKIKGLVSELYGPMVYGQVVRVLDPKEFEAAQPQTGNTASDLAHSA